MAIHNFTPSVKLLIHVVHIEGWFCHLCLCYENKYSVRSFVNEFWLKLKGRCKTSALTGKITTVYFWCLIQGVFFSFLKFLMSFSWNSSSAKIHRITFWFCLLRYSIPYQPRLNCSQIGCELERKDFFLSHRCIPQIWGLLGSLSLWGALHYTGRNCLLGTCWRGTLEKNWYTSISQP